MKCWSTTVLTEPSVVFTSTAVGINGDGFRGRTQLQFEVSLQVVLDVNGQVRRGG